MTFVDKTAASQTEAVTFEVDLKHKPKKVWRALTDPQLLTQWLLPVIDLKLEPGARFMFKTDPHPGWDGTVSCKLVEIDEPNRLSYEWGVPGLDTVVTFTLTPTDAGTKLLVVQSGFRPDQKQNFGGARYGWRMMGGRLIDVLDKLSDSSSAS
jgi:uncharacterized protein YndB with AHSA1/START domain